MHRQGHPEACTHASSARTSSISQSKRTQASSSQSKLSVTYVRALRTRFRIVRSQSYRAERCAHHFRDARQACPKLVPHFDQFSEFRQVRPVAIMKWPFWSDVSWHPDLCFANPLVDIALYICRVDPPPEVACRCCLCADIKVQKSCFVTGPLWVIFSFEPGQLPCEDMIIQ